VTSLLAKLKAKPEISLLSITEVAGPYPCDIPRFNTIIKVQSYSDKHFWNQQIPTPHKNLPLQKTFKPITMATSSSSALAVIPSRDISISRDVTMCNVQA
jgi:hypothetical protein